MRPEPTEPTAGESRDRLIDALLAQHLGEGPLRMESRYARAMSAIDSERAPSATGRIRGRTLRIARAALITLAACVLFVLMPVESRASSVLAQTVSRESIERTADAERRYEVEVRIARRQPAPRGETGGGGEAAPRELLLRGNWDMRGYESRLELRAEGMPALIRADSAEGAWEMREGARARDLETRELWPRWIEERDGRIAVERMDELLRLVQRSYHLALARAGAESSEHLRGALHIVASRRERAPGPEEVDLWIDTDRNVVLEAHLRWPTAMRGGAPTMPPARGARPRRGEAPPPFPQRPPPPDEDYRAAPGALPPMPPLELRLRRIEPITFPDDHFRKPAGSLREG